MIARDEAENISRCLRSVAPIADEMIVVDSGSTDETAALARECGAAVFPFAWCDDFAAARNAALERATGDWILSLDADEWLPPESQPLVRPLLDDPQAQAYFIRHQELEREGQTDGFIEQRHLRLWRNDPSRRFVGRIHEQLAGAVTAQDSPIRVRHTGYLPEKLPDKARRNAPLLEMELAERPGRMYYEVELGRTWVMLGDPRGPALLDDILARLLALPDDAAPPTLLAAPVLERCLRLDDPASPRVRQALSSPRTGSPTCPRCWTPPPASTTGAASSPRPSPCSHAWSTWPRPGSTTAPWHSPATSWATARILNLAVCHHRLAQLDEAEHWYERLLDAHSRPPRRPGEPRNAVRPTPPPRVVPLTRSKSRRIRI